VIVFPPKLISKVPHHRLSHILGSFVSPCIYSNNSTYLEGPLALSCTLSFKASSGPTPPVNCSGPLGQNSFLTSSFWSMVQLPNLRATTHSWQLLSKLKMHFWRLSKVMRLTCANISRRFLPSEIRRCHLAWTGKDWVWILSPWSSLQPQPPSWYLLVLYPRYLNPSITSIGESGSCYYSKWKPKAGRHESYVRVPTPSPMPFWSYVNSLTSPMSHFPHFH
jgi:hypothetical protein